MLRDLRRRAAALADRVPRPGPVALRRFGIASLVANILLVVTGGAVRLTASGLGCPTFPRCTGESLVPTPENGVHGLIEFGNRLLTFVLAAVALATLVAAYRALPARRDLRRLALAIFLGIPAQALIGGITVLTKLNPWTVMLHFLCSMVLIGLATVFIRRAGEGDGPARPIGTPLLRRFAVGALAVVAATVYAGTVVTGSGPHAGDRNARRTGLDVGAMSQLHADLVFLLIGVSVGLLVLALALRTPARTTRAMWTLVAVELGQGVIGYVQYFTGLPITLVDLHMLGAALLVAAAVDACLATRVRPALPSGQAGQRDAVSDVPAPTSTASISS